MSALFAASGAIFAASWFVFFDGFVIASRGGFVDGDTSTYFHAEPFNFLMFLPGLLALLALAVLACVKPEHIVNDESDESIELIGGGGAFGGDEESAVIRSKVLFCISFVIFFTGLGLGVWKLIDPYTQGTTTVSVANVTSSSSSVSHLSHLADASNGVLGYLNRALDVRLGTGSPVSMNAAAALGSNYDRVEKINVWPGIAVVVQVALMVVSAILCLVGRRKSTRDDSLLFY